MKAAKTFHCSSDEAAETALRRILLQFATIIDSNRQGVIDDHDPEHLHDLRVANRRTRTALGELKGVLDKKTTKPFRREFKWLAQITGSCRDHDVWLDDLEKALSEVAPSPSTGGELVRIAIHRQRQRAWRDMKNHMRTTRLEHLLSAWQKALTINPPQSKKRGAMPVAVVAGDSILKAYSRLVQRRSEVVEGTTEEALHRTRIDAKKLRYLLEFFSSLYPAEATDTMIRGLKRMQDQLGRFNDCAVQRHLLRELRSRLEISGRQSTKPALTVVVDLEEYNRARQSRCRAPFRTHFLSFTNESTGRLLTELAGNPGC